MEYFRIKELEESSRHWDTFYQCPQLENRGTDDALSESVAEWLIGHCENGLFRNESIRSYIRAEYNMSSEHRQQLASFLSKVNHKPEHNIEYAMFMRSQGSADIPLNVSIGEIGIVLDHQVPLVDDTDAGVRSYGGKIDLLSYSSESNTMFILELKEPKSSESLLKCMIEGYTYFRRIGDISKFKRQFNVPESANVVIAPLFLEGSAQHRGYLNLNKGKRNRIELFEKIDVDMRARLGDNRCKVAFAIVNRTTRFTPHNSLDGLKVSVSRLDAVRSNQK